MNVKMKALGTKADAKYFIFRDEDPKEYGHICPGCQKRYGQKQGRGFVDVLRCKECPTFEQWEMHRWYKPSPCKRKVMESMI